jgi:hypothetical protein
VHKRVCTDLIYFHLFLYFAAKKTSSSGDLVSQLEGFDFPKSQDTETFARELQRRLPRKSTGLSVRYFYFLHCFYCSYYLIGVVCRVALD